MDSSEEIAGRVTRSKLKRLGSVESDISSRPGTPLNKLLTIAETDSPSKAVRKTRRNSVVGAGTPSKNQLSNLTKTPDVSSPRKVGRPRAVPILQEKENTPGRRVTRSQSTSPPNLDLSVIKPRGKKLTPTIKEVKETDEEVYDVNSSTEDTQKKEDDVNIDTAEPKARKSPRKRNASESSKSVCFNETIIDEAEKTVYPKTPLHLKGMSGVDIDGNTSKDSSSSFNDLFGGSEVDKPQTHNDSVMFEEKLTKTSSTPKLVTQNLQIKLRKFDDGQLKKKLSESDSQEKTPVKEIKEVVDNAVLTSQENEIINESKSCVLLYSSEDDKEEKSPKTPNKTKPKEESIISVGSSKKSRNSLLDSIVNEEGKVYLSQRKISLRMEAESESESDNESNKTKIKTLTKTARLNKSMPEKQATDNDEKAKKFRYSTSNLDDVKTTGEKLTLTTIPVEFENDSAISPKERKSAQGMTEKMDIVEDENPYKNSEKLSKSFTVEPKEKKSVKNSRHSMAAIHFSQDKTDAGSVDNEENINISQKESKIATPKKRQSTEKTVEDKNSELVEEMKMVGNEENSENDSSKEFLTEEVEKAQNNSIKEWGTMAVHGTSNQKIDSIKCYENKENVQVVEENPKSDATALKTNRKYRNQILGSSDEESDNEEENEEDDDEMPHKSHPFVHTSAIEVDETYESGDSLDSELAEEMRENEIPNCAESLGSQDTDESENEEDHENDSFITSDTEEELLDYEDEDEGIDSKKEKKRRYAFSSDSEDENDANVSKSLNIRRKSVSNQINDSESNDEEQNADSDVAEETIKEKETDNKEDELCEEDVQEKTPKKLRNSLNRSANLNEEETETVAVEKQPNEVEENIPEEENIKTSIKKKRHSVLIEDEVEEPEENSEHNPEEENIKTSIKKKRHSVLNVTQGECEKNDINDVVMEDSRMDDEDHNDVEIETEKRKRKRVSQNMNMNIFDNEVAHKNKKVKLTEMEEQEIENEPILEENQTNNKLNDSAVRRQRVQDRCDEILEAANHAKMLAKLQAKQNAKKLPKQKQMHKYNEENNNVDTEIKPDLKDAMIQALKASTNILFKKSGKNAVIEEKIKSKQLAPDIMEAIMEKVSPVKQKKVVKKITKISPEKSQKLTDTLITSAGEVRVLPSTPPPKHKNKIQTFKTATGLVRVEPTTPKLNQKAGLLRESPVTPHSIGFRVRQLMGDDKILPEYHSQNNNKRSKKRNLVLDEEAPANAILQPQWTTSGDFKVEKCVTNTVKKVLGASNFGASENALKFKMNAMAKVNVPKESSSKILQRKKRQAIQQRF